MKKLILLALTCTAIVLSNCTPAPSPTPAAPAAPATIPTTTFTHADSLISGNWILDLTEMYLTSSGALISSTTHTDPANCHLNLKLVTSTSSTVSNAKECTYGLTCSPQNYFWRLNSGDLELNGLIHIIISQTPTNLVLEFSSGSGKLKYFLHK